MFVAQSCLTLCNPMDSSPPGSSSHGILQAKILEWIVIPFCRGSSQSWDQTQVFCISGRLFSIRATREAPIYLIIKGIFWQRNIYTFYYHVIQITNIVFHPILKNTWIFRFSYFAVYVLRIINYFLAVWDVIKIIT